MCSSVLVDKSNWFQVETYRLGYSYRATDDFEERHRVVREVKHVKSNVKKKYSGWGKRDWDRRHKRNFHLDRYGNIDCYSSAPKGKLFYKKCV